MTTVHHWKEMGREGVRSRDTEEKDTTQHTFGCKKKKNRNLDPETSRKRVGDRNPPVSSEVLRDCKAVARIIR